MALEDYLEPEIAVTAAVTAVLFSRRGRRWLRQGAVYGLAGVLVAGDAISAFGRTLGQGIQKASASASEATKATFARAESVVSHATTAQTHERYESASDQGSQEHPGGQQ
jgi:flavin-dependent dehydrogenase